MKTTLKYPLGSLRVVSSEELTKVAGRLRGEDYVLLYDGSLDVRFGCGAEARLVAAAEAAGADMVYSDFESHPLIDCLEGALRDDFDFGAVMLFKACSFRTALESAKDLGELKYAALYDIRLRMKQILHISEPLYSAVEKDTRASGEKQFDYVNPRNRDVQIEMEKVCTDYLRREGAILLPGEYEPLPAAGEFPVDMSVVIPVYNRVRTIKDAVESALNQKTDFNYNVIVVDNYSADGTSEILEELRKTSDRLIHLVPQAKGHGIGGCWNEAVFSGFCGRYAVQLDSDDVYSSSETLQTIMDCFRREENCGMVIGSYNMTDFYGNPLPPGIIDHKEWTEENGRNNALRINGLGAPRAFFTPALRAIGGFPDVSYGEDYAAALAVSRRWRIARVWTPVYNCRRWEGNSDAALSQEKVNANNLYKDSIRTAEFNARRAMKR